MTYKIDRFNFSDKSVENMKRVGITPEQIEGWIADGRNNGVSDEGIRDFIVDKFHELNNTEEKRRGANVGGALRYLASNIPFVGTYADEAEATIRSALGSKSYEEYLKNARDSQAGAEKAFKANTSNGNWFDRNIGTYAPLALNVIGNAGLAALTGGATLMPGISGVQGAVEGFGRGEGLANRSANAGVSGAIGFAVPAVINKFLPTKSVAQKEIEKQATKGKNTITQTIAKAMQTGDDTVETLAKNTTRGTRPAVIRELVQDAKSNTAQAKILYNDAVRNVDYDGGFVKYMQDGMPQNLSKKYATALNKAFDAINPANMTDDVLASIDPRELVDNAINTAMKGASSAEKEAVRNAAIKRFSDRSMALQITRRIVPSNANNQISVIRPDRIFTRPISNILKKGTLNTLQNRIPLLNVPSSISNGARGTIDALIEQALNP